MCPHCCYGGLLNVKINASGYEDKSFVNDIIDKGNSIENAAQKIEEKILSIVNDKILK
jgi:glutamate formiminotransferase/formiminotetrahydrofolate cyclodeaminase